MESLKEKVEMLTAEQVRSMQPGGIIYALSKMGIAYVEETFSEYARLNSENNENSTERFREQVIEEYHLQ